MTVDAPFHVITVHHLDRPFFRAGDAMAGGAVHAALDVDPVRKNDVGRKFIHPLPRNPFPCFHVFHNLQRFGPLADGIARMACPAEIDIRNSRNPVPLHKSVAERAVQLRDLFVVDVVEQNGLLDGDPSENGKQGEENTFGLDPKPVVGNNSDEKSHADGDKGIDPFSHVTSLFKRNSVCQVEICRCETNMALLAVKCEDYLSPARPVPCIMKTLDIADEGGPLRLIGAEDLQPLRRVEVTSSKEVKT